MKHGCNIIGGTGGNCCQAHDQAYQKGEFTTKIAADFALFGCFIKSGHYLVALPALVVCLTFGSAYWLKYLARRLFGWFPKA